MSQPDRPLKLTELIIKWLRMNYGAGQHSLFHTDVICFSANRISVYNERVELYCDGKCLIILPTDPDFFSKITQYFKLDEKV